MHTPLTRRRRAIGTLGLALTLGLAATLGPLAVPGGAQSVTTLDPPPTVCPAEEGNARFVRFIYLNILFRCPSQADITYWTGRLDGGLGRGTFALQVDMSDENLVLNNVVPLYVGILGRDPSASELTAGVAHIRQYRWDGLLIAELAASDEYYDALEADPGSELTKDQQWLDQMFQNILDRPVDEASLEYYTALMGEQSTQAVRHRITRTLERSSEGTFGWIFGVYFAGLNRPPADGDIAFWNQWLLGAGQWRAFQMWTSVLSSPEGYARAQTQPSPEQLTTVEGRFAKR
jgi:hypothetical protein